MATTSFSGPAASAKLCRIMPGTRPRIWCRQWQPSGNHRILRTQQPQDILRLLYWWPDAASGKCEGIGPVMGAMPFIFDFQRVTIIPGWSVYFSSNELISIYNIFLNSSMFLLLIVLKSPMRIYSSLECFCKNEYNSFQNCSSYLGGIGYLINYIIFCLKYP